MEMEASMFWEMLDQHLGLQKGVFLSFNFHRHHSGILPWNNKKLFMLSADIHSILWSIFSTDQSHLQVSGILVGDKVGLRKMVQTIGLIVYLNYIIYFQEHKKPLSSIISMSLLCDY